MLFCGKTGIFDHDPRGEKQTARIYRCAVETEDGRLNHRGEPYKALKGWAYMVRTAANADLIYIQKLYSLVLAFCIMHIKPVHFRCKQSCLISACSGADLHDYILVIIRILGKKKDL